MTGDAETVSITMRVLAVNEMGRPSLVEIVYEPDTFPETEEGEQIVLEVAKSAVSGDREGRTMPVQGLGHVQ